MPRLIISENPISQMRRIMQAHGRLFARAAAGTGLTRPQFMVICALLANRKATQVEIQQATGIDRSTVSQIMESLKAKGFARIARSDEDLRANAIVLTQQAVRACRTVQGNFTQAEKSLFSTLSGEAQKNLGAMLASILANFEKKESRHARSAASDN